MLCLTLGLTACGGGGDGDGGSPPAQQPATGFALVRGQLTDSTGAPLSAAQVYMPFGNNQAWGADTDGQGRFSFQARAADFAGVSPVSSPACATALAHTMSSHRASTSLPRRLGASSSR